MMNISDVIEDFILNILGDNQEVNLSRNELADHFNVAPSQINYVLATRFSLNRGYFIDSKRGKGGSVTIIRIYGDAKSIVAQIIEDVSKLSELTFGQAFDYMVHLLNSNIINEDEFKMLKSCIEDKALANPLGDGKLRKQIFLSALKRIYKEGK